MTFTVLLQTLSSLPNGFDLHLDNIRINADSVSITGSLPNLDDKAVLESTVRRQPNIKIENSEFQTIQHMNKIRLNFNMSMKLIQSEKPQPRRK